MKQFVILITLFAISLTAMAKEHALGKSDAPITLIEYGSLTCDACNYFHRAVLPSIDKNYIQKGEVQYIYRHFPTGAAALQGAIAVQCAGDQYYEMLDKLYLNIEHWYEADNQKEVLTKHAQSLGVDAAAFTLCINGEQQKTNVLAQQQEASKKYGVIGTPTFVINGKVVKGKRSFAQMQQLLDSVEVNTAAP